MSTTHQPDVDGRVDEAGEIHECAHCGGDRTPATSVAGSFCSTECHRDHQRQKRADELLELIEHDHRFCRTCFSQLKEVEKGGTLVIGPVRHDAVENTARDVLVGYQYRTDRAEIGEISKDVDDDLGRERPIVEDGVATGTICKCGATDHRDADPTLRETEEWHALTAQLVSSIETLRSEEKHDIEIEADVLASLLEGDVPVGEALTRAVILE